MENSIVTTPTQISLYEATLGDLPEGILWTNAEGFIIYANTAAGSMFRETKESLLNRDFSSIISEPKFHSWLQNVSGKFDGSRFEIADRGITLYALVSMIIGKNKYGFFCCRNLGKVGVSHLKCFG